MSSSYHKQCKVALLFIYKKSLSRPHTKSLTGKANYCFKVWNGEGRSPVQAKCLDSKPWKEKDAYLPDKVCCSLGQNHVLLIFFPLPIAAKQQCGEPGVEPGRTLTPNACWGLLVSSVLWHISCWNQDGPNRTWSKQPLKTSEERQRHVSHVSQISVHCYLFLQTSNPRCQWKLIRTTSKGDSWHDGNREGDKGGDKREAHQGGRQTVGL